MIIFILLEAFLIIALEFLRYKQSSLYDSFIAKIQFINEKLEILKAFSFALHSKNESLGKDLNEIAASFFKQSNYKGFSVLQYAKKSKNIDCVFRCTNKSNDYFDKATQLEKYVDSSKRNVGYMMLMDQISSDERIDLVETEKLYKSIYVVSLNGYGSEFGTLVFFSELDLAPNKEDEEFIKTTGYMITMLIRKFQFIETIDFDIRLKAVNVKW